MCTGKSVHESPTYWGGSWCQWDRGQQLGSGLQRAVCGSLQEKTRQRHQKTSMRNTAKQETLNLTTAIKKTQALKGLITEGKGVVFSCGSRKEEGHQSFTPFLTHYINTHYQSTLFRQSSKQFNCGGLTVVFLCSHQWHNCKSTEAKTLQQAASGFQWIRRVKFSLKGFIKEYDSRVISTKAQIFDIFKPAVVYLWT